ncbi:ATP-binding protein [Roseiflexus sp.]|uniref:ATP-binding protein n=1 Tax=Roseiflexus sp. TaxID=2562120 RepID=UPI00258B1E5B|nr:ATP-binding protein [Roseiflexus sp.]
MSMIQRSKTLRVRFAIWTGGLLCVALLLFSGFVYWQTAQGLSESLDTALQASALQITAGLSGEQLNVEDGQIALDEHLADPTLLAQLQTQGLTIRVLDRTGAIRQAVGAYHHAPVDPVSLQARSGTPVWHTQILADGTTVRVYTVPVYEHDQSVGLIQIMQSLEPVVETLQQLQTAFAIGIPALTLLAGLGGYWLAARALQPITNIIRTAQQISATDLHARITLPPTDDEVGRLAATFNGMLSRLEDAFRRERQFTADASHELRTPVAAMEAIITVTRERPRSVSEYTQALDDLLVQTRRLRSLIDDLLQLTRSETRYLSAHAPVNLSLLLEDVTETMRPLAEERGLVIATEISPNLAVVGDSDGLIRLWLNVLDNAIKYTPRGTITLRAFRTGDQVTVTVTDSGIGIAPEHLPFIFERFYRVDPARSGNGNGLGLAIAREIVRIHHGTITVTSELDHGTTFTVNLPTGSG